MKACDDSLCTGCRKGHYVLGDGSTSNYPCQTDGCGCWFCGPIITPAQAHAAEYGSSADQP